MGGEMNGIIRAGGHTGTTTSARIGNDQRALIIPLQRVFWAGIDTFCAHSALAATLGDIEPLEFEMVNLQAWATMAGTAGIDTDSAAIEAA